MEREKKAKGIKVGERKQLQLKARQRKPKKGTCYKASQKACSPGRWVGYSFSYEIDSPGGRLYSSSCHVEGRNEIHHCAPAGEVAAQGRTALRTDW